MKKWHPGNKSLCDYSFMCKMRSGITLPLNRQWWLLHPVHFQRNQRSLASPQLPTEFNWKKTKSCCNCLCLQEHLSASCPAWMGVPRMAMDRLDLCVCGAGCDWDALDWAVLQSAARLNSLPGLSDCSAAKVDSARSPEQCFWPHWKCFFQLVVSGTKS